MAYITASDISSRLTADQYVAIFDRDENGAVSGTDLTFVSLCISTAESVVNMASRAAFGAAFDSSGTVDEAVKAVCVDLAIWEAVKRSPLIGRPETAPYRLAYDDAHKWLDRMTRDDRARPVTSGVGRAHPRGATSNTTDETGEYTNRFARAANRQDPSDF